MLLDSNIISLLIFIVHIFPIFTMFEYALLQFSNTLQSLGWPNLVTQFRLQISLAMIWHARVSP